MGDGSKQQLSNGSSSIIACFGSFCCFVSWKLVELMTDEIGKRSSIAVHPEGVFRVFRDMYVSWPRVLLYAGAYFRSVISAA